MRKTNQHKKITLENYTHSESKRINNPPVGLVSSQTDRSSGKTKYSHDPHIDPFLSWAGKTENIDFEIPNVSLHIHERIDSQQIAKSFLKKRSRPTQPSLFDNPYNDLPLLKAVHFYEHEQDWSNRLIAGDSLLVMNSLLQKEGMAGKLQMIYIDPPYGIKYNSNFQPFVSKIEVKDNNDADIPAEPEMIKAFRDTWELGIHSYLNHLYDRLLLARELLNESGSCFIQISDENVHLVRTICAEVFGSTNFISEIIFRKKGMTLGAKTLETMNDYIIWYAKNKEKVKYRQLFDEYNVEGASRWTMVELPDGTRRKLSPEEYKNHKILPNGAKVFRLVSQRAPSYSPTNVYDFEFNGKTYKAPGSWVTNHEGMKKLAENKRLYPEGENLSYIQYLNDFPMKKLTNLWGDTTGASEKIYVVQTGDKVISRCILMSTDPGDLVMDPTCGSGTTAYVSEQLGRRWITCDTSRVAITLTKQRLMTAKFDYYELAYPEEGIASGLKYKNIPHITLASIANNEILQSEILYDHPIIDKNKIRVAGPFTVEAVPGLRTKPFESSENKIVGHGTENARTGDTNNLHQWIDELRVSGIRTIGGKTLALGHIEPMSGPKYLHAEGEALISLSGLLGIDNRTDNSIATQKVVVSFGPDFGPIDQRQVENAIKEARSLKEQPQIIIFAAFQFDPEAAKDIDQINNVQQGFVILKTQMSVDLLTADLRKKRSSNQSYWLIGQPDIELYKNKDNYYQVKVNGFDYYNPVSGEIESGSEKQIAIWMLDTDYDEQSIMPTQVFFPVSDSKRDWTKLAKALNGTVDEELLEMFTGTESLPFTSGENKKIAVKIIDNRGIESFVVKNL